MGNFINRNNAYSRLGLDYAHALEGEYFINKSQVVYTGVADESLLTDYADSQFVVEDDIEIGMYTLTLTIDQSVFTTATRYDKMVLWYGTGTPSTTDSGYATYALSTSTASTTFSIPMSKSLGLGVYSTSGATNAPFGSTTPVYCFGRLGTGAWSSMDSFKMLLTPQDMAITITRAEDSYPWYLITRNSTASDQTIMLWTGSSSPSTTGVYISMLVPQGTNTRTTNVTATGGITANSVTGTTKALPGSIVTIYQRLIQYQVVYYMLLAEFTIPNPLGAWTTEISVMANPQ